MMLKKSKDEVLKEINAAAMSATYSELSNNLGNLKVDTGSLTYALQRAIASAVEAGFEVLLESRYTDDDFEKDITLKP